jgi:hypothetical protein
MSARKVYPYSASVVYRDGAGQETEEKFPVVAPDRSAASDLAVTYVLEVLKLREFELRIVGA